MAKRVQVTLTGNESKRLIAKAAVLSAEVQHRINQEHQILLIGGTTVSAMSEELGFGPMRISGRIDAGGTRTALNVVHAPHSLLIRDGQAVNADKNIQTIMSQLGCEDLIVTGANAIDIHGRAALAFAELGGGGRGRALNNAYLHGVPMLVLCGLNKLVPDIGAITANQCHAETERSMGAAIGLYNIFGPIITEIKAFEILFHIQAVAIAGSGIGSGEGSRTFLLIGEEENINSAWDQILALKGSTLSGNRESLVVCRGGCENCHRHMSCMYVNANLKL